MTIYVILCWYCYFCHQNQWILSQINHAPCLLCWIIYIFYLHIRCCSSWMDAQTCISTRYDPLLFSARESPIYPHFRQHSSHACGPGLSLIQLAFTSSQAQSTWPCLHTIWPLAYAQVDDQAASLDFDTTEFANVLLYGPSNIYLIIWPFKSIFYHTILHEVKTFSDTLRIQSISRVLKWCGFISRQFLDLLKYWVV